jgi:hypothetical protein
MKMLDEAKWAAFSLTPCFSGVLNEMPKPQPFQRFPRVRKTAEAVAATFWPLNTPLKQGVNEISPS